MLISIARAKCVLTIDPIEIQRGKSDTTVETHIRPNQFRHSAQISYWQWIQTTEPVDFVYTVHFVDFDI